MKTWTWEMLKEAVHKGKIFEALDDAPKKIKPLMALALSVAKWHPDRHNELFYGDPEGLRDGTCGLCMYWAEAGKRSTLDHCFLCPLGRAGHECNKSSESGSLWRPLWNSQNDGVRLEFFRECAVRLYDKLVELYLVEYFRVWPEEKEHWDAHR
jgi:hypothetical protein